MLISHLRNCEAVGGGGEIQGKGMICSSSEKIWTDGTYANEKNTIRTQIYSFAKLKRSMVVCERYLQKHKIKNCASVHLKYGLMHLIPIILKIYIFSYGGKMR